MAGTALSGAHEMSFNLDDYRGRLLIASGDFSTEILSRGWESDASTERANVAAPALVRAAADAYLDAGADILVTHTDHANALAMAALTGTETDGARAEALNLAAATLCRSAVSDHPSENRWVFGAVGPPLVLTALEEVTPDRLREAYQAQVRGLVRGGVDGFVCRGFSELEPLLIALACAVEAAAGPVFGGMLFDAGTDQTETSMAVTVPQACQALDGAGCAGLACEGREDGGSLADIVRLARESCDLPIWATLGLGEPEVVEGRIVYPTSIADYGGRVADIVEAGASILAGGQGVMGDHIAGLVAARARLSRGQTGSAVE